MNFLNKYDNEDKLHSVPQITPPDITFFFLVNKFFGQSISMTIFLVIKSIWTSPNSSCSDNSWGCSVFLVDKFMVSNEKQILFWHSD